MEHAKLLDRFPLISDQVDRRELSITLANLEKKLAERDVGAVVEFGCYIGTTSLFIRRMLDAYGSNAAFHVYDSFEGLPEKREEDRSPVGEQFKTGELSVSKKEFIRHFKKASLALPVIHKGWFSSLSDDEVPDDIIFAYLDGDYYESILTPLRLIEPKLADGAIIVIDDYANEALPGAAAAVNEWLKMRAFKLRVEHSLAIIST